MATKNRTTSTAPKAKSSKADRAAIARDNELAFYATAEIEVLLPALRDQVEEAAETDPEHLVMMRSLLRRIRELNSVAMSIVSREGRDFNEMNRVVHGAGW